MEEASILPPADFYLLSVLAACHALVSRNVYKHAHVREDALFGEDRHLQNGRALIQ